MSPTPTFSVKAEAPETAEIPKMTISPKRSATPAELVIICVSGSRLHIWSLPEPFSIKQGTKSQLFDLSAFAPELCIEDVSFLEGFDRDGCVVGVAGSGGVVLVVDWRRRELLWKVGEGARGES